MSSPQPTDPTAPIQPPLDFSDDGPGMTIGCSILAVLATACVALRFWSKRLARTSWQLDDYLALLALGFHHALFASSIVSMVGGGLGRDIRLVAAEDPNAIVILFKSLFASEISYGLSSSTVKLSVLAFYYRIFPTKVVMLGCYILGSMCIAWTVSIEIVNVIQCRPLRAFWHLELQALPTTKCIDPILYFLGNSIANCVIDFVTLTLPVHEIIKLHTSRKKKIGIASIFLLGSIAFAASLVRTISTAIMHNEGVTNFTKQFVVSGVVTVVEVYVAIIGACLPTLVPVYRRLRYGDPLKSSSNKSTGDASGKAAHVYYANSGSTGRVRGLNSLKNSAKASASSNTSKASGQGSFDRLHDGADTYNDLVTVDYAPVTTSTVPGGRRVNITSQLYDGNRDSGMDMPMQGIMVKSDLTWAENADSRV